MGWEVWAPVGGSDPSWVTGTLVGGSGLSGWLCHHPSVLSSTVTLCGKENAAFVSPAAPREALTPELDSLAVFSC